ncbi:MAG: TAT-variant-translocated molybdopterin oxidoreductase [Alphaproteobacteria bacterium]|nr:TAT-variant-translocated molybdopterin oxidoreductase [Alphaproteobacteria bacterium]
MSAAHRDYWRSLEELAESPGFAEIVEREAPRFRGMLGPLDRRNFMRLMAAAMALSGLSDCGPEPDPRQLLPYIQQPPGIVPGHANFYATATTREGYATGVLVAHLMARPVKVEGNPAHPASLGAASAIMQASILELYDPRRTQTILGQGQIDSWEHLITALFERREQLLPHRGAGLRLLTGTVTSPSLSAQIKALQQQFPEMRWHQWEPINRDNEHIAIQRSFGRPLDKIYNLDNADIVFAVESDLISSVPGWLAYARQFAAHRRPDETGGKMSRIYAIESTPTLIGAKADHRLPLSPTELVATMRYLAAATGAGPSDWKQVQVREAAWLDAAAQDLLQHHGRVLVHAGREQPVEIHLIADAINGALGAFGTTIRTIEPVAASPVLMRQSLEELVSDMAAGRVDTLMMLDTNPVYNAPANLDFATALKRVPMSVSLSLYADETAVASTWMVPAAQEYEAWGDARAFDGTITIQQPQVRRLYEGHSPHELLAVLQGNTLPIDYELVRTFWQGEAHQRGIGDFERFWHESLRIGIVESSAAPPAAATPAAGVLTSLPARVELPQPGIPLIFRPDLLVWDGRYTNNPWLLEMPRPFTRLTWDNAALIAPATAKRLNLDTGDVLEITYRGRQVRAPVFVLPGQAPECITLPLGFGHQAGALGAGIGFDAYHLRISEEMWTAAGATLSRTGETFSLATTQGHDRVAGRDLIREGTLTEFRENPGFLQHHQPDESLYPPYKYPRYAWAMAIDLNSCIGCQACAVACQAENNVPVVGKDMVLQNREMHWLRIDRYYSGPAENPGIAFEPVPCMHCEDAPCEVVCPVHATVHDHEGINLMVYNRCVGTRFCSNNCPYKVRRFNFYGFAYQEDRPAESWNPQVTVRNRGVMEKCTYCIQRVRTAQIEADKQNILVPDGAVMTACQQSCPTQAIIFGNRNDPESAVVRRKSSPLDYVLLDELNTRPRTSYTALIRNPNPQIEGAKT